MVGRKIGNSYRESGMNLIARKDDGLKELDVKCRDDNVSQCLVQFRTP